MPTLHDRARDQLVPEPLILTVDKDGWHFGTDAAPLRTIIDVKGGFIFAPSIKVDSAMGSVTIALDGRTVTYTRRGFDLHGRWICDLVRE